VIPYNTINQYLGCAVNLTYDEVMAYSSDELRDLLFTRKVLVFKNWHNLTPKAIIDFATKFGKPWSYQWYKSIKEDARLDSAGRAYTDYTDTSYARLVNGIPWHVDIANEPGKPRYPARILYCVGLPDKYTGLTTDIANLARAYSDMSDGEKAALDTTFYTYQSWQKVGTNIKDLPAVAEHPYTKEKFIRLNAVSQTNGWIRSAYQMQNNIPHYIHNDTLKAAIASIGEKYQYSHSWEVGDLVIWDNWSTMHRKGAGEISDGNTGARRFVRISVDTGLDDIYCNDNPDSK